jgi:hypothetical protein
MSSFPLIDLLYRAANAEFGIIVETSDVERLRQKLYTERKKDPALANISINVSRTQPETQLWIVKK